MKFAYAAALLLAVPLYLPRLLRSFWVDEAGTYWMAYEGLASAIEKCSHWPGQSILYGAIASLFCLDVEGPWRDPLLRVPSLAGIGLMLYFTSRLATKAIGPWAGLCTFILLLFHPASLDLFSLARPYGLAAAAVAGSYYFLYEWANSRQRRHVIGFAAATTLIFYLHYLFAVALAGHAVYLGWVFLVERRTARWKDLAVAFAAIALLLLPLAPHILLLLRQAHTFPPLGKPSLAALRSVLLPKSSFIAAAVALLLALLWRTARPTWVVPGAGFVALALGWWTAGTLALFALTRLTTHYFFMPRYLGSALPAEPLVLAAIGAALIPGRWVVVWAALVVLATTANPFQWHNLWLTGGQESRPVIEIVRQITPTQPPPLFFQSGLIESNFLDWRQGPEGTYLFSELAAYPVPNHVYPLPIRLTDEVKPYFSGLMEGQLRDSAMILLVCQGEVPEWIAAHMGARGYRLELARPNVYTLAIFRR